MGWRKTAACLLALAHALHEASSSASPTGFYDEECGPVFRTYRRYGAKQLSRMSTSSRDAIMKCRNITESDALQRDAEFEERRRLCIGLHFPTVPEEQLEEHLCRDFRMDDNEDVQKMRNITACLRNGQEMFGKDERQVLELRASRIECMQRFFGDAPRGIRDRKYSNLVQRVRALTDSALDTQHQIAFCMGKYEAPDEEQRERSKAKSSCMRRLVPDVSEDRLESVFLEHLRNRSSVLDDALSFCTFMETPTGKWAREEMNIHYDCFREVLSQLPSRARSSLSFRLGLDVQHEVMDKMLRCESKGGTPVTLGGIQRPMHVRCVTGIRRHHPHSAEIFESPTIYDNPDPLQKMKLCVSHKRSSSDAFLEYRHSRKMEEKETAKIANCYNRHLNSPTGAPPISGITESDPGSDYSNDLETEEVTLKPLTTVSPDMAEVGATLSPMTTAMDDMETVKAE
ncbi:uncharacterized protein LOC144097312 [Amblyomma americanum]